MKVREDIEDRCGRFPIVFKSANLRDINEWLFQNYGGEGYKFAIVIDVSKDEFEPWDDTQVLFLDEIESELKAYKGE